MTAKTAHPQSINYRAKHPMDKNRYDDTMLTQSERKARAEKALMRAKQIEAKLIKKSSVKSYKCRNTIICGYGETFNELTEAFDNGERKY